MNNCNYVWIVRFGLPLFLRSGYACLWHVIGALCSKGNFLILQLNFKKKQ